MFQGISFKKKKDGEQTGAIASVTFKTRNNLIFDTFYIKTHQNGISSQHRISNLLDPREIFVYKFLFLIGIGPEVHFYFSFTNPNDFYIATKTVDKIDNKFSTINDLITIDEEFRTSYQTCIKYKESIVYVELLSKMLFLSDIASNSHSYGFIEKFESIEGVKIVDFLIKDEYIENEIDMVQRFIESQSCRSHPFLFEFEKQFKIETVRKILNTYGQSFIENLIKAKDFTNEFLNKNEYQKWLSRSLSEKDSSTFVNKLEIYKEYVDLVSRNIQKFIDSDTFKIQKQLTIN